MRFVWATLAPSQLKRPFQCIVQTVSLAVSGQGRSKTGLIDDGYILVKTANQTIR